jgi:hypothetical protein
LRAPDNMAGPKTGCVECATAVDVPSGPRKSRDKHEPTRCPLLQTHRTPRLNMRLGASLTTAGKNMTAVFQPVKGMTT